MNSRTGALRVAGIGSCRILTPLSLIERKGHISVAHKDVAWYTHSTQDVLQKIEIITGRRTLQEAEVALVIDGLHKYHPEAHHPGIFDGVRCFIVEISTIKGLSLDGLEIHQWCFRNLLLAAGVSLGSVQSALQLAPATRDLSFLPNDIPPLVRDVVARGITTRHDETSLRADLTKITETLGGPVIFVPHFNLPGSDGNLIPERVLIARTLESFAAESGFKFVDPTPFITEAGTTNVLLDLGHYKPVGDAMMADRLHDSLDALFTSTAEALA